MKSSLVDISVPFALLSMLLFLGACGEPDFDLSSEKSTRNLVKKAAFNADAQSGSSGTQLSLLGELPTAENNDGVFILYSKAPNLQKYGYAYEVGEMDCAATAAATPAAISPNTPIVIEPLLNGSHHLCVYGVDANNKPMGTLLHSWDIADKKPELALRGVPESGSVVTGWLKFWVELTNATDYQYFLTSKDVGCDTNDPLVKGASSQPIFLDKKNGLEKGSLCVRAINGESYSPWTQYDWVYDVSLVSPKFSSLPQDYKMMPDDLGVSLINSSAISSFSYSVHDGIVSCQDQFSESLASNKGLTILGSKTSGFRSLCIQVSNGIGVESPKQTYVWKQKGHLGELAVAGLPEKESMGETASITVAGENLASYRHLLLDQSGADCTQANLSQSLSITEALELTISLGDKTLCLMGEASDGTTTRVFSYSFRRLGEPEPVLFNNSLSFPSLVKDLTAFRLNPKGAELVTYKWALAKENAACTYGSAVAIGEETIVTDTINDSADGVYKLCVQGQGSGDKVSKEVIHRFELDGTAPILMASNLPASSIQDPSVTVGLSINDNKAQIAYVLFPGSASCNNSDSELKFQAFVQSLDVTAFVGLQTLCIWGWDEAGNLSDPARSEFAYTPPP